MVVGRAIAVVIAALAFVITGPASVAAVDGGAGGPFETATRTRNPFTVMPIGCVPDLSAGTLDAWMRGRLGPLLGFDNPKFVRLGGDRTLWLLTDPYVDLSRVNNGPLEPAGYVHNAVMVQEGRCFSLVQ